MISPSTKCRRSQPTTESSQRWDRRRRHEGGECHRLLRELLLDNGRAQCKTSFPIILIPITIPSSTGASRQHFRWKHLTLSLTLSHNKPWRQRPTQWLSHWLEILPPDKLLLCWVWSQPKIYRGFILAVRRTRTRTKTIVACLHAHQVPGFHFHLSLMFSSCIVRMPGTIVLMKKWKRRKITEGLGCEFFCQRN